MKSPLKEFVARRRVTIAGDHREVSMRLRGLLDWMEEQTSIKKIIRYLKEETYGEECLREAIEADDHWDRQPPQPRDLEDIAGVGLALIEECRGQGKQLYRVAKEAAIRGAENSRKSDEQDRSDAAMSRYIIPFLEFVEDRLPPSENKVSNKIEISTPPAVIHDSLRRFNAAHRSAENTCFIMMRFGKTQAHSRIEKAIKATLKKHGLIGLLARDKEFHDDLYPNIQTYIYGCAFGIAVFERLETDEFNPNVALEVGHMFGLRKQVLLLKDRTLRALHTDLIGKLYREFDPQDPEQTVPSQVEQWLSDKGLA